MAGHLFSGAALAGLQHYVASDELVPAVHSAAAFLLEDMFSTTAWRKLDQSLLEALLDFGRPNAFSVGTVCVVRR